MLQRLPPLHLRTRSAVPSACTIPRTLQRLPHVPSSLLPRRFTCRCAPPNAPVTLLAPSPTPRAHAPTHPRAHAPWPPRTHTPARPARLLASYVGQFPHDGLMWLPQYLWYHHVLCGHLNNIRYRCGELRVNDQRHSRPTAHLPRTLSRRSPSHCSPCVANQEPSFTDQPS